MLWQIRHPLHWISNFLLEIINKRTTGHHYPVSTQIQFPGYPLHPKECRILFAFQHRFRTHRPEVQSIIHHRSPSLFLVLQGCIHACDRRKLITEHSIEILFKNTHRFSAITGKADIISYKRNRILTTRNLLHMNHSHTCFLKVFPFPILDLFFIFIPIKHYTFRVIGNTTKHSHIMSALHQFRRNLINLELLRKIVLGYN